MRGKALRGIEKRWQSLIAPFLYGNDMSISTRISTSFFTALPGALFFALVITSEGMRREYFWVSILTGVSVLLGSSVFFGFILPTRFRPKWFWIIAAGFLAMALALITITVLNATPLCVGQDNGDGNNNFGMCMGYVLLYAIFYGVPYMMLLTVSAATGHWAMKVFRNPSQESE